MGFYSGLLLTMALLASQPAVGTPVQTPLIVVLQETGVARDDLPVYTEHEDAARYAAALTRGFAGRMLRLFRWEQQWLAARDGRAVEPAYLLLSNNQGGFPRFGFWLGNEQKAGVGYVDIHQRQPLTGRFGAIDQIFPHELAHVLVRELAGATPDVPGANQVHAIGVRTDPRTAFDEGFAEHMQILAIDDPDAAPETAALGHDPRAMADAEARYEAYRRSLVARWSPAPPARMGFLFWFSRSEQVSRYFLVKANRFARQVAIPPRLLEQRDPYAAYLLDNVLPGAADAPLETTSRLLATEGVVASLFWRWATDDELRTSYREPGFYERFGTRRDDVGPLDNVYLKIFAALADSRTRDTRSFLTAYVAAYPDEAAAVDRVARATGLELPATPPKEIWLANDRFSTGTSLFDQFRGLPRVHTFDLNAAGLVDLVSVDGATRSVADAVLAGAPYRSLTDVGAVPGVTTALVERLQAMASAAATPAGNSAEDSVESLGIAGLLRPSLYRAALWMLACGLAGAWLYGRVQTLGRRRLVLNGLAAASIGLLATWILAVSLQTDADAGAVSRMITAPLTSHRLTPFLPVWLFGLPGALWHLVRRRSSATAARALGAWALACLPALLVTRSWL